MAHAPIRTHLCFVYNKLVNYNHVIVKLAFGQPARESNRLKIRGRLVNVSAGLHLIDQLGKGSEKCSVCKPFAYSRSLRLFP